MTNNKFKFYTIWGLMGLIVSSLPITQLFTSKFSKINFIILYIPNKITGSLITCGLCDRSIILNFIILLLFYPTLAVFIVFLMNKIKWMTKF